MALDSSRSATALAVFALLLGAGCGTSSGSREELKDRLERMGHALPGRHRGVVVVPIHADSSIAAWTLVADVRADGSPLPKRVARRLELAASRRQRVVVGGFHDELSREVVLAALRDHVKEPLGGLDLVYVGDESSAQSVVRLATQRGARAQYRKFR